MKNKEIVCLVAGMLVILCLGAASPSSKFWQDVLRKPSRTWQAQYDRNMPEVTNLLVAIQDVFDAMAKNDLDLAFNVRSLLEVQNRMAQEVVALNAKVEALSDPNDPNEVK